MQAGDNEGTINFTIDFTDVVPENGLDFGEDTEASLLETINNRLYEGMLKLDSFARDGS
jgi:hypothetical protein